MSEAGGVALCGSYGAEFAEFLKRGEEKGEQERGQESTPDSLRPQRGEVASFYQSLWIGVAL